MSYNSIPISISKKTNNLALGSFKYLLQGILALNRYNLILFSTTFFSHIRLWHLFKLKKVPKDPIVFEKAKG